MRDEKRRGTGFQDGKETRRTEDDTEGSRRERVFGAFEEYCCQWATGAIDQPELG